MCLNKAHLKIARIFKNTLTSGVSKLKFQEFFWNRKLGKLGNFFLQSSVILLITLYLELENLLHSSAKKLQSNLYHFFFKKSTTTTDKNNNSKSNSNKQTNKKWNQMKKKMTFSKANSLDIRFAFCIIYYNWYFTCTDRL